MGDEDLNDAGILSSLRRAMFNIASGGANVEYTVAGRTFRKSDLEAVQRLINTYESRVAAAASPSLGGGGILVRLGEGCGSQPGYDLSQH